MSTWIAKKAAMQIQFPIKQRTPRCQLSIPTVARLENIQPGSSASPTAAISWFSVCKWCAYPNRAGPRNRTIKRAPETQTSVPPTLA